VPNADECRYGLIYFVKGSSCSSDVEPDPEVEEREVEHEPQSLLNENQLFRLNEPKRSMRMYSDDIEKKSAADRLSIIVFSFCLACSRCSAVEC